MTELLHTLLRQRERWVIRLETEGFKLYVGVRDFKLADNHARIMTNDLSLKEITDFSVHETGNALIIRLGYGVEIESV